MMRKKSGGMPMADFDTLETYQAINILALFIGLAYGAVAQKRQFCFSGAIKDYFLTGSTRRGASLLAAMITAILSTQLLSSLYDIDLGQSIYLQSAPNYLAIIAGGVLFGIGMMLADGCSSRHLVKLSQGNLHSLITLLFIAIFAYMSAKGLFAYGFDLLEHSSALVALSELVPNSALPVYLVVPPLLIALVKITPSPRHLLKCIDGVLIGLLVGAAWVVTGLIGADPFDPVVLESLSFVYPSGKTLEYLMYFSGATLSFGVTLIFGIIAGGFFMSLFNKKYRFGCAAGSSDQKLRHAIFGGALMGSGGILALGCTIGQGMSGLSTLAAASLLATLSIAVSACFTAAYLARREALPGCFVFEW